MQYFDSVLFCPFLNMGGKPSTQRERSSYFYLTIVREECPDRKILNLKIFLIK